MENDLIVLASPFFLGATALGVLLTYLSRNRTGKPGGPVIPRVTQKGGVDPRDTILQAYEKYKDQVFQIENLNETKFILPPKYLSEIVHLPEATASLHTAIFKRFQGNYTGVGKIVSLANTAHLTRSNILRRTAQSVLLMCDEAELAVATAFGSSEDWCAFPIYGTLTSLAAQLISRVFVGVPRCRDPEWLDLVTNIAGTVIFGATTLSTYPIWLRSFVAPWLKDIRQLNSARRRMKALMIPVLKDRASKLATEPGSEAFSDMVTWTVKESEGEAWDPIIQTEYQITISIPAINTTSQLLTNVVYDLCAHPSFIKPLRDEWQGMIFSTQGKISEKSLLQLRKMDSFIRESQRLSPFTVVTVVRDIHSDVVLSNGAVLPRGSSTAAPLYALNRDPRIFENPDDFDGERFIKLWEKREMADGAFSGKQGPRWGLLDIDAAANLNFGLGKNTCPGGLMATNVVKLLVGHILMEYDFRLEDEARGRPTSKVLGNMLAPDPKTRVLFRKR